MSSFFRVAIEQLRDTALLVWYHRVKPMPVPSDKLSSTSVFALCSDLKPYWCSCSLWSKVVLKSSIYVLMLLNTWNFEFVRSISNSSKN